MTDEEIVEKVSSFPARMVILTGGEPSLWIDKSLISRLREAGKQVCIETNGTRPLPDGIDEEAVLMAISPEKDVDAFHAYNVGKLTQGRWFIPGKTCPHTPKSPHGTISCNPAPAKIRKR